MKTDYELYHHGIKGQKWGVRRYQSKNGKLTPEGRKHLAQEKVKSYVRKTSIDVQGIVDSISDKERRMLGAEPGSPYLKDEEVYAVVKRFMKTVGKEPVAFLDIYRASNSAGSIALATRSGEQYRGHGYAADLVKKAKKWMETPEAKNILDVKVLNWFARRENTPSINLAKKAGFIEREDYKKDKDWWGGRYVR